MTKYEYSSVGTHQLDLKSGLYLFECWGSVGGIWEGAGKRSTPGYGGYTSGVLYIREKTTLYVYIGNTGFFNAAKGYEHDFSGKYALPGGATDIRLNASEKWWDIQSLISRIMVAAGGGGSEWAASIGGNGGGIEGGASISGKTGTGNEVYEEKCEGANQDSGSNCTDHLEESTYGISMTGSFGSAGFPLTEFVGNGNYGGFGGGGYYGGTSYGYAYAGSGGSSYISGYKGCDSVEESTIIHHTKSPYHYSEFIFRDAKMVPGNQCHFQQVWNKVSI